MVYLSEEIFFLKGKNATSFARGIGAPNTVFVKGDSETLIIDPGVWTYQYKKLRMLSKRKIVDVQDIKKVCLTHHHWDHSNLSAFFQKKNNAEIYAHEHAKAPLEDKKIMFEHFFSGYEILHKEMMNYPLIGAKIVLYLMWGKFENVCVNHILKEGDKLDFDIPIEIIELPSHTPCCVGYYFPKDKMLAIGDLMDLDTGIGMDMNNPFSDYDNALKSAKKLLTYDIDILIPGHGPIVEGKNNIHELVSNRINKSEEIRRNIVDLLKTKEYSLSKLIQDLFGTRSTINYLLNKHLIYCYLINIYKKEGIELRERRRKTFMKMS
ncbi:MAG: MBL fold metallo-hydrolase [Candidatus Heimdallarchaeota archaeon]|nr:MBL fold metallo-hydrolase [Candidatus Heimdallarchaeota archaeon]MCG3256522.1 MBL fold metallo-hydrolase [Candidatus Heimdallarchaeota archaeon]MCK4611587.1 MBL fold metallo-hydrolase [Candidatus Heimdallarchaeota archaeon]